MDIRQISPDYAVSPQINPSDVATIKAAGFTTIICNRPDAEIPPSHHAEVVGALAKAEGLKFVVLPVTHQDLNEGLINAQRDAIENSAGPVFAYCASGTRCSIVWALGQVGLQSADEILSATTAAGYDLGGLRPQLEALSKG
jgi:uncharacterized protein (TIGR01244 family)